jgi:large subunit ribosomal protein L17
MRHHNTNRKFGRTTDQRRALLKSLSRSLVQLGRIETTEARAKEIRPLVEKLVTRGKVDTAANRRILVARLGDETAAKALVKKAQSYNGRAGGYLRITKLERRLGDAAAMAVIEFV